MKMSTKKINREKEILKLLSEGNTYKEVGEKYNVSKQRINQIAKKNNIKRWEDTQKLTERIHRQTLNALEKCTSIKRIATINKIDINELEYRFNQISKITLNRLLMRRRDNLIIDEFKKGKPASQIIKLIKPLEILQPRKINTVHGLYGVLKRYGVKRYPQIKSRRHGGTNLTKNTIEIIKNKRRDGLSFQKISDHLNEKGIKTITEKRFHPQNLYNQKDLIGLPK
jgi:hypothetical protein